MTKIGIMAINVEDWLADRKIAPSRCMGRVSGGGTKTHTYSPNGDLWLWRE